MGVRFSRRGSVLLACLVAGCGFLGEKGKEPKGDTHLPASGVGKFLKQDFYCDAEFVQPFFPEMQDPEAEPWISGEPWLLEQGGAVRIFFERRSETTGESSLFTTVLDIGTGAGCRELDARSGPVQEIVFDADPGSMVGAPTVVRVNGQYHMWFSAGRGESIRHAFAQGANCTVDDCHAWTLRTEPVLVPNQDWEQGGVGSPSVLFHNGLFRMWYDGDAEGNRAIGYAWSQDGEVWTKTDASGAQADAASWTPALRSIEPVLRATQTNWEFWYPDPSYGADFVGRVGQPCVIVHLSPLRTLYLMYYSGNLKGKLQRPVDPLSNRGRDANIGIAWSEDGKTWEKAPSYSTPEVIANEINPIVSEKLAITLDPNKPPGSINVFSTFFMINEAGPAVLEYIPNQLFFMLWEQTDWVNLHVAADLPIPPATESGYQGSSGIGFAFSGNIPGEGSF
jgi:hypothetical protein